MFLATAVLYDEVTYLCDFLDVTHGLQAHLEFPKGGHIPGQRRGLRLGSSAAKHKCAPGEHCWCTSRGGRWGEDVGGEVQVVTSNEFR